MSNLEFAVGKRVVCIDDDCRAFLLRWGDHPSVIGMIWPTAGQIYTIRDIICFNSGKVSIRVEELHNPPRLYEIDGKQAVSEAAFPIHRFRPVRETSIDCFTALLEKPPVKQTETV